MCGNANHLKTDSYDFEFVPASPHPPGRGRMHDVLEVEVSRTPFLSGTYSDFLLVLLVLVRTGTRKFVSREREDATIPRARPLRIPVSE